MGIRSFQDRDRAPFGLSDGVQINLGRHPAFVAQYFLDGPDRDMIVIQNRCAGVPECMKPKVSDARLFAQGFHKALSLFEGAF